MTMEASLKTALGTTKLKPTGQMGGGCCNEGEVYLTDKGKVFVKTNFKPFAREMFEGEMASLEAIRSTKTIRVPQPLHVVPFNGGAENVSKKDCSGAALVMEALDMSSGRSGEELGVRLARMHKHNKALIDQGDPLAERRFGFPVTTYCGILPMDNTWKDDWPTFFAENRIEVQIRMLEEKRVNREVRELWDQLRGKLPKFFHGIDVFPALVHGDLWSGNKATVAGEPVIYDPACFFGHSEYDFGIIQMFGGFGDDFFKGYYSVLPKQEGHQRRYDLYELFHQLNHWNHFGSGYMRSTISLLKRLISS